MVTLAMYAEGVNTPIPPPLCLIPTNRDRLQTTRNIGTAWAPVNAPIRGAKRGVARPSARMEGGEGTLRL